MAAEKVLGLGVVIGFVSTAFLLTSLFSEKWFIIDASEYRKACREDEQLKQSYPWLEKQVLKDEVILKKLQPGFSGEAKEVTSQQPITLGTQTEKWMERPHNDWPAPPKISPSYQPFPAPLTLRDEKRKYKHILRKHTKRKVKPNQTSTLLSQARRKKRKWNKNMYVKVAAWNQLAQKIESNLHDFGGRDTTFDRRRLTRPSGERGYGCLEDGEKSIKNNETKPCKVPDCSKWQLSTHAGLWRTCLTESDNPMLAGILSSGKMSRCAATRYSDAKMQNLPSNLLGSEREDAYKEEWKALHLKRILVSFLCMAAPVHVFGLITVCYGWMIRRGFDIYAGGLVLVMSGTFQLLAIGTSGLLFDVELNRKPKEIYDFPEGVTKKFGRSAHALWVSSACSIMAGLLCAITPSVFSIRKIPDQKHLNGHSNAHIWRSGIDSAEEDKAPNSVDVVININNNSSPSSKTSHLKNQAYSVDTGKEKMEQRIPISKITESNHSCKTLSAPNLCEYRERQRGRSSTRRSKQSLSSVVTVRTPHSAVENLHLLNSAKSDESPRHDIKIPTFRSSFHKSLEMSDSVSESFLRMPNIPANTVLSYSRSLIAPNRTYDYNFDLTCWATVDISQRLRHARYARRTSHSCEETASRIRNIMRGLSLDEERRTRSLPRPTMRHTPLSEISINSSGSSVLRDHCELFLQRHGLSPCASETIKPKRGRAAYLNALARNNSEDTAARRARLLHPPLTRWSHEGIRRARSSEESQRGQLCQSMSRDSTRSHLTEREGTLDSVRECSESDETSPIGDNVIKNSSEALETPPKILE